jgi:hypothetical protein
MNEASAANEVHPGHDHQLPETDFHKKNQRYEGTSEAGSAATRFLYSCRNDQKTETSTRTFTAQVRAPIRRPFAA